MSVNMHHILRIVAGAMLAVVSMGAYFYFLFYVVQAGQELVLPDSSITTEQTLQEFTKISRETKKDREFTASYFATTDTFLSVFSQFEQIRKEVGGTLTVESVNAESSATKQTTASVRVILKTSGSWDEVEQTIHALTVMPTVLSVLAADIAPHPDQQHVFDARVVLRVYIKPQ